MDKDLYKTRISKIAGIVVCSFLLVLSLAFAPDIFSDEGFDWVLLFMVLSLISFSVFYIWYLTNRAGVIIKTDYTYVYNTFSRRKIKTDQVKGFKLNPDTRLSLIITNDSEYSISYLSPPSNKINPKLYNKCQQEIDNCNEALREYRKSLV
jgi:hypothetical protein